MKLKDLVGNKIGKLTVVERGHDVIYRDGRKRAQWVCLCECGNKKEVSAEYLRQSKCPSCGCEATKNRVEKNRVDYIGKKFNRLTITDILWDAKPAKAVCICDCGNKYIGIKADIVNLHTKSCGCLQSENTSKANTKDWSGKVSEYGVEFIQQSFMNDSGQWMWQCKCGICGKLFNALPAKVNNGHITSCGCRVKSSNEEYIENLLDEIGVEFKPQYIINDCKNIYPLRFDFALLHNDSLLGLIEYDGRQHFQQVELFGGEQGYLDSKKRDNIKNTYCLSHNIPLLRIPYTLNTTEIKNEIYEYYLSLTTAVTAMAT